MVQTVVGKTYAVAIGDIVASRQYKDQTALIKAVIDVLAWVNERIEAVQPLQMTVGDEFQGVYAELGSALDAALLTRLRLAGACDLRFGIGWGEISSFDPERAPMAQSGAAWWSAREAIEQVVAVESKRQWPRTVRTRFDSS